MGIVRGLKSINSHVEAEEAKFSGSGGGGTRWFKIDSGQSVKVLFLQELDEDSEFYSAKNDLGFLAVEHVNPEDFKRKAVCTADEGACWACEQHRKDYKAGWKQKTRLYINVLVDDGVQEPYVAVLSQGNGPKSITPTLLEYAAEGGITQNWFKIKRTGTGMDTSYALIASPGASGKNVEDFELFDLMNVVRQVPYEQQEAHYFGGGDAAAAAAARESTAPPFSTSLTAPESDW